MRRHITSIPFWSVVVGIVVLILLGIISWYIRLQFESISLEKEITARQEQLMTKQQELQAINIQDTYRRFKIAQIIISGEKQLGRESSISYLIDLFDTLQKVDQNTNISLDDFQIHTDKVTLRGTVDEMQTIYGSWGLLDKFIELEFVEHLEIPFYKQVWSSYEFILEATLKSYDTN